MRPDGGYVRLYRRVWDNKIFGSKQEAAVFAWMVSAAQWKDSTVGTKHGPVSLSAGQVIIAERSLSDDFGLHRNTIRRLLQRLVDAQMVSLSRDQCAAKVGTVLTVINYLEYQSVVDASSNVQDRNGTATETNIKKGERMKKRKKDATHPSGVPDADLFPTAAVVKLADPVGDAVAAWNALAAEVGLSSVRDVTNTRRASTRLRLKDCGGLEGWLGILNIIRSTPFLLGQEGGRGWKIDFDALLTPRIFNKVREGAYGNRGKPAPEHRLAGWEGFAAEVERERAAGGGS